MILTVQAESEKRLSAFLRENMQVSSGLMNRLKWKDGILVNDVPRHTDYPVQPGDRVSLLLDEEEPDYPSQDGPLSVLYEDAYFLAVDKPSGMLIHPSRARLDGTLANYVLGYYRRTGQKSVFHPVTRLDRDTFGIVLVTKNSYAHALAQSCRIQKTYHAVVFGGPPSQAGTINAPIARRPLPSLLREVREDGKPSVTEYRVIEQLDGCTRLALRPVTGRTHQLRVHCSYMGCPILGDPQYGSEESQIFSAQFGLQSQLLCAKRLEFVHPITGQPLVLESRMDACL